MPEFIFISSLCSNAKLNRSAICWDIIFEVAWRYSAGIFSGPDALFEFSLLIPNATSSGVIGFSSLVFSEKGNMPVSLGGLFLYLSVKNSVRTFILSLLLSIGFPSLSWIIIVFFLFMVGLNIILAALNMR